MTATEVARHFSEVLTRIEREGETIEIIRNGKRVAVLGPPAARANGAEVARFLRENPPDPDFWPDVQEARRWITDEVSEWPT
jgi:antitoxin (DNA-binding transcriptional repressor) of toxin-antitoxin stability system